MEFEGLEDMAAYEGKQFISDLEGPVTRNDNASEVCEHFIQRGQRFFSVLARYDHILSYALHRQGYRPGDSSRLVLPFLKAYGVTDNRMHEFSRKHISVVPGADKAMRFAQELMACFLVSTSYEHYVSAVCEEIAFPFDSSYCTRVSLDSVRIDDWESQILKNFAQEIALLPLIDIPPGARSLRDFTPRDQHAISRLDEIFWQDMSDLSSYRLLVDTNPMGGEEKAASIVDVCKKTSVSLEDTMYIGDNATDVQALALVRRGGGMPIAFNGNEAAIREAEVLVLSENAVVTSILVEAFHRGGKDGAMSLVESWNLDSIRQSGVVHDYLIRELYKIFPERLPKVVRVTQENLEPLVRESIRFRKAVGGEAVGGLG